MAPRSLLWPGMTPPIGTELLTRMPCSSSAVLLRLLAAAAGLCRRGGRRCGRILLAPQLPRAAGAPQTHPKSQGSPRTFTRGTEVSGSSQAQVPAYLAQGHPLLRGSQDHSVLYPLHHLLHGSSFCIVSVWLACAGSTALRPHTLVTGLGSLLGWGPDTSLQLPRTQGPSHETKPGHDPGLVILHPYQARRGLLGPEHPPLGSGGWQDACQPTTGAWSNAFGWVGDA